MGPEAAYLAELQATTRPIKRQHCLQRASNELPPAALTRLYLHLPALGGRALCKLAPQYRFMTTGARLKAASGPQLVMQPEIGAHRLYISPAITRAEKTLFVLFSGHNGQFFIPFSALLSLLPNGPKDVLAVRSTNTDYFLGRADGLGHNAFAIANAIKEKFNTEDYARVVVVGFSTGGFFALRVAAFLKANIALSFAGVYLDEGFRIKIAAKAGVPAFDPICACRAGQSGRIINVVASKNEYDFLSSKRLRAMRPRLREYHMVNTADHNVLLFMLRGGYAQIFLKMALARNGAMIWLTSTLTAGYGRVVVRGLRRLFGRQKIDKWYLARTDGEG